jgi:hypothetical protein
MFFGTDEVPVSFTLNIQIRRRCFHSCIMHFLVQSTNWLEVTLLCFYYTCNCIYIEPKDAPVYLQHSQGKCLLFIDGINFGEIKEARDALSYALCAFVVFNLNYANSMPISFIFF